LANSSVSPDAHLVFLFAGATMGQLLRAMQRKTAG
jgi:hypothetical protein